MIDGAVNTAVSFNDILDASEEQLGSDLGQALADYKTDSIEAKTAAFSQFVL